MNEYNEYIGDLIDRGKSNSQIVRAVLRLEQKRKLSVPIRIFAKCDQLSILWNSMSESERRQSQCDLNQYPPYGFLENEPWVAGMRMVFRSSGLNVPVDQLPGWLAVELWESADVRECFSGGCNGFLQRIGVIDGDGRWCEKNFQKVAGYIDAAEVCGMRPDRNLLENYMRQELAG